MYRARAGLLPDIDELGGEVLAVAAVFRGPGKVDPGAAVVYEHHAAAAGVLSVLKDGVGKGGRAIGADGEGKAGGGFGAVDGHGDAVGAADDDLAEFGDLPGDGDGGGATGAEGETVDLGDAFLCGDRARALDVELPGAIPGIDGQVGAGGPGWRELGGGGEGEGSDEGERFAEVHGESDARRWG